MAEVTTGWSGLPLIWCPKCRDSRVIERTSVHGEPRNNGKVFYKCKACEKFMWEDEYKKELVKACEELEILRSENAQLRSIVANQQLQIEALVGKQDEGTESYVDSDVVAEAFSRICRLQDVAEGADPSEGGTSYVCDCDCPNCCEPDCQCIMYHPRS